MSSQSQPSPQKLTEAGSILLDQGKLEEAIKYFSEAIELDRRMHRPTSIGPAHTARQGGNKKQPRT